ncbi:MAG: hypothetical protein Q9168_004208 [Polycauliona sp. 1 TL-2023]
MWYNKLTCNIGVDSAVYCSALINVGLSRIPSAEAPFYKKPSYYGAITEHLHLLNSGRDVISELIKDLQVQKAATPILLHHDLHKRNIFVSDEDPTIVSDIIDWQSTSINPAFMHANDLPDFATPLSTTDESTTDENTPSEDTPLVHNSKLCNQAYSAGVTLLVPKLYKSWEPDGDIIRFFEYCHRTYRDGAAIFRQILIDLSTRWNDLGMPGPCPYSLPTPQEALVHQEEYGDLEKAQRFKKMITDRLNTASDGWAPTDAWRQTVEDHKELCEQMLATMRKEDLEEVWPFDDPDELLKSQ